MSGIAYRGPVGNYAVDDNSPQPGGPFSALISSMHPGDMPLLGEDFLIASYLKIKYIFSVLDMRSSVTGEDYDYDEFGFIVEEEDGPEQSSSKLLSRPFLESPDKRLQWTVELELGQGCAEVRSDRVSGLVLGGVPHSLRHLLWPRLLNTHKTRDKSPLSYQEILSQCSNKSSPTNIQIEKDLLRTLPANICFIRQESVGVARLRRVLRAVSLTHPDVGYCQGMGMIVATLLLTCREEDTYWMMSSIIEDLLPPSYYSSHLWGARTDQQVLQSLMQSHLPQLAAVLDSHHIELGLVTLQWFITLFSSCLQVKILIRLWDLLFYQGTTILFRISLAMLKRVEKQITEASNSAEIFNILTSLPATVDDFDELLELANDVCDDKVSKELIDSLRRKHLSQLMSDVSNYCRNVESGSSLTHLGRQPTVKRKLNRSKSIVEILVGAQNDADEADARSKNVRRTEMFVYLREAVVRIGSFFQGLDPVYHNTNLQPDYSLQSHDDDVDNFMKSFDNKLKRARATVDFERNDDDELGFCKNDIITIVSQEDEHCWVGEINGFIGWFPAKFVEMIDERSKVYSSAGDDRVNETITDLVRGPLASSIKQMLEQGMKTTSLLQGSVHPWLFIVDAANEVVQSDYKSVFSRLVLCKTFK